MNLLLIIYFCFSITLCKKKHYIVKTDKHYIVETKKGHGGFKNESKEGYGDHGDLKAEIVPIFNSSQDYDYDCDGIGLLCMVKGMKNIVESGCKFT